MELLIITLLFFSFFFILYRIYTEKKWIGIFVAFGPEYEAMLPFLDEIYTSEIKDSLKITTGRLSGKDIILCLTGVSIVNASRSIQWVIDRYRLRYMIFGGIAGSGNPSIKPGDVVVPRQWFPYGEQLWTTDENVSPFFTDLVRMPPFKCKNNDQYIIPTYFQKSDGSFEWIVSYTVDDRLYQTAKPLKEKYKNMKIGGIGCSGSIFQTNINFINYLRKTTKDSIVSFDMETTALGQLSLIYNIPFIGFRLIVDSVTSDSRKFDPRELPLIVKDYVRLL